MSNTKKSKHITNQKKTHTQTQKSFLLFFVSQCCVCVAVAVAAASTLSQRCSQSNVCVCAFFCLLFCEPANSIVERCTRGFAGGELAVGYLSGIMRGQFHWVMNAGCHNFFIGCDGVTTQRVAEMPLRKCE